MGVTRTIAALCVLFMMVLPANAQQHKSIDAITRLIDIAEPNAVIVVPPGIYEGNLTVTKPVVLDGKGLVTIDGMGEGNVVELGVAGIEIRGFLIRGSGSTVDSEPAGLRAFAGPVVIEHNRFEDVYFGIDLRQSHGSIIRNNVVIGKDLELGRRGDGVRLWWSHECVIEDNEIHDVRDMVFWYSEDLSVARNFVTGSRYGLHFMYSHNTTLKKNELVSNSVGIYLMYSNDIHLIGNNIVNNRGSSGYGIGLKDCDAITVEQNAMLANRVGIYVDNSPSSVDSFGILTGNKIAFNEIGMLATPITHDIVLTNNAFVENDEQVTVHGRGQLMLNKFSDQGVGNFWSNYPGFDQDNDGIGDFAHEPRSLFRSLLARQPNLRIFVHSPAQQAIELTARAFPELSPEPIFVDSSPLSKPPMLNLMVDSGGGSRIPMILISIGLLLAPSAAGFVLAHQSPLPASSSSSTSGFSRKVRA